MDERSITARERFVRALHGERVDRAPVRSVIDAIAILRRELGDRAGIVGKVYGPWSLAYHTFGLAPFLEDTIKDPGKVAAVLERLVDVTLRYAIAQVEAGAEALCLGDHITANLVRPDAYPRLLRDIHRQLGEAIPAPLANVVAIPQAVIDYHARR